MKKLLFTLLMAIVLTACGTVYNTQLKQVELKMTPQEVINLMGDKYTIVSGSNADNQTIEYVDRYKNHWRFQFVDGELYKWGRAEDFR